MPESRAKTKSQPDDAAVDETPKQPRSKREAEPGDMVDIGDAAATGEFAYAGERSDDPNDERADEARPGTSAHLGSESPYAGSPS